MLVERSGMPSCREDFEAEVDLQKILLQDISARALQDSESQQSESYAPLLSKRCRWKLCGTGRMQHT
uniref:Uncharacterized protein n=1 Tax=Haemonchus contortus TaxID=6289 RepID=A0A7I4Z4T5_HAECO